MLSAAPRRCVVLLDFFLFVCACVCERVCAQPVLELGNMIAVYIVLGSMRPIHVNVYTCPCPCLPDIVFGLFACTSSVSRCTDVYAHMCCGKHTCTREEYIHAQTLISFMWSRRHPSVCAYLSFMHVHSHIHILSYAVARPLQGKSGLGGERTRQR
jgi:hypothetical protein